MSNNAQLYVFFLENEKWLLHPSTTSDEYYLLLECYLMYEFAKTNLPIRLFETLSITDRLEIDMYVKKYMHCYGVENVRGGNFTDEHLPSTTISMLEKELEKNFYEMPMLIENICRKYESIQKWTPNEVKLWRTWRKEYEFIDQPDNIKDAMNLEKQFLKQEWMSYEEHKHTFQSLTYCSPNINLNIIDFTKELEWLKMQIENESSEMIELWSNKEDGERYKVLLQLFDYIKQKFISINENLPYYERDCFIKTPVLAFDSFIYHRSNIDKMNKERKTAIEVFEIFEYMFNYIMNRIEEQKFSLNQYPDNYENQIRFAIEYIDYIYFSEIM